MMWLCHIIWVRFWLESQVCRFWVQSESIRFFNARHWSSSSWVRVELQTMFCDQGIVRSTTF